MLGPVLGNEPKVTASREDSLGAALLRTHTGLRLGTAPPVEASQPATLSRQSRWAPVVGRRLAVYWKPVAMLAASRVVMLLVVFLSRYVSVPVIGGVPGEGHGLTRLEAWDGGWYITAAQHGWPHAVPMSHGFPTFSTLAFFPAFPLAIRAAAFLGIGWILAGVFAALASQIVAVILLWQLAKEIWSEPVADRGLLLFLFGPGAVAFALIYSEPMLFASAAACLLALRRRWWLVAGLSAAVGTAVRPVGVALVACCAWEAVRVLRSERQWRPLLAPLLAPLGMLSWTAYLWAHTGNPFIWSQAEKAWDDNFDPFTLVKRFLFHEVTRQGQHLPRYLPVAGAVFCALALVLLVKARPTAMLVVYSIVVVAIAVSSRTVGLRPRLVETAFPLVLVFGYWLKDNVYSIVLACAALTMGALLLLTMTSPAFIP
jgi:hypothetical protein